jgi:phage terminase large subunit GpA-like protein
MKPFACSPASRAALQAAIFRGLDVFTPKPPMTLSEWADEYAYIPAGSAEPGKFITAIAEYQRQPMMALSDPHIRKVVLIWAAQTGKSQILNNAFGYYAHYDPSYMLMIQPTLDRAEEYSKIRIAPMIRETPVLRELFPDPRSRDSGNTLLLKEFPGGWFAMVGANAPSGLASKPVRILFADEVDRFPESAGTEGDVLDLVYIRLTTFWNSKAAETSTPLIKGQSRIVQSWEESDQRYYLVPCPHCGLEQALQWGGKEAGPGLKFTTDTTESGQVRPKDVWYECVNGCRIEEASKYEMVRVGHWSPSAESRDGRTAGFHLNALYSPWVEWTRLVLEWLSAQRDAEKLQVFTNTRLAEAWELKGDGAEDSALKARKEPKQKDKLPARVLMLTMGVDVQRDRLEATIWGWGLDNESWIIHHRIMRNSPALPEAHPESPWRELDDYRKSAFEHPSGKSMRIDCTCVDSGDQTKLVYDYTRKRERQRVYATKGVPGFGKALVNNGSRPDKNKTLLYLIGVDTAKERIYSGLKQEKVGAGYVHILDDPSLGEEYLRQLASEHLVTRKHKGRPVLGFELREGRRNEALDCGVMAMAAREIRRPNFEAAHRALWGKAAIREQRTETSTTEVVPPKTQSLVPAPSVPSSDDPFAGLPILAPEKSTSEGKKGQNWRDSWKIL